MGYVIKQAAPGDAVLKSNPRVSSPQQTTPHGTVLSQDAIEKTLLHVEELVSLERYVEALPDLLNLEVTQFENFRVHQLLTLVYYKINQMELAQEQSNICSDMFAATYPENRLKTFEQLVAEAGDPRQAEHEYNVAMNTPLNNDNFFEGSKKTFRFAAHLMNQHRYQDAEKILRAFRDRTLEANLDLSPETPSL
ncbi:MAG: hypothetical protein ACRCY4_04515 [Brevinema sp.]